MALAQGLAQRQMDVLVSLARFAKAKPLGMAGAVAILLVVAVAVLAPAISPYDPLRLDLPRAFTPPGHPYLLGTDNLGRDILSRIIWGAQISLSVSLLSVLLGDTLGALLGLSSGYFGGKYDMALQRFFDSLMAFPSLILALTVVAVLGPSLSNVVLAIAVTRMPFVGRVMRASALRLKHFQFVEAARATGCKEGRILLFHIFPNALAPLIIVSTGGLATAILIEGTLSFMGVGLPPPTPSWGAMLAGSAQQYVTKAPWMAIAPGAAIVVPVFGFNMLGDALRDVLDPRLRGR